MLFTYVCANHYLKEQGILAFVITHEVFKSKGAGERVPRLQTGPGTGSIPAELKLKEVLGASRQGAPPFQAQKSLKHEGVPPQTKTSKKAANQNQMGLWAKEDS